MVLLLFTMILYVNVYVQCIKSKDKLVKSSKSLSRVSKTLCNVWICVYALCTYIYIWHCIFYQILIYPLKYFPQKCSRTVSTVKAYARILFIKSWSINRVRYINKVVIHISYENLLSIPYGILRSVSSLIIISIISNDVHRYKLYKPMFFIDTLKTLLGEFKLSSRSINS